MKTKRKTGKLLSLVLSFVLALGALPVMPGGVTAKAETETEYVSDMNITIDNPLNQGTPCAVADVDVDVTDSGKYYASSLDWYEGHTYSTFKDIQSATKFTGQFMTGCQYTAVLNIYAREGYTFDAEGGDACSLTEDDIAINCANVTIDHTSSGKGNVRLFLKFTASMSLEMEEGITYAWNNTTQTLTISGTGAVRDKDMCSTPFYGNSNIKNIVINEGITGIGNNLFGYCQGIESIQLPSTLTHMGSMEGARIKKYIVAEGNGTYTTRDVSLYSKDGKTLVYCADGGETTFTVPSDVTKIGAYAFGDGLALEKLVLAGTDLVLENNALFYPSIHHIEIAEGVKDLGNYQFLEDLRDNEINLPATLASFGEDIFLNTNAAIDKVTVATDNPVFYDIDGVVLTKEGKLVLYPAGKTDTTYRTPEQVHSIGAYAFYLNESLKELELGVQTQSVENQGINQIKALEKLTVYNPECTFVSDSVYYCKTLEKICAEAGSTAQTYANSKSIPFEAIACELEEIPVARATMEANGVKAYYKCKNCRRCYSDAAGTTEVTAADLVIPKVASVAFPQSEYDYTVEYAAKGWAKHVVVTDDMGNQLKYGTDYSVTQEGENLFGVCSAKVEGKGNYNFEKNISCTVHPSSTLRFPDDINKLNHGSYTINLYNSTKTCVINGDERIMSYGSLAALIEVDKKINTPSEQTFDLDKDGSADLKVEMGPTSVCEGGAPIRFEVLSTCSVKENKTFTLSDYAEEFLKNTLSVPYYDSITFHFVYPCASGHSYGSEWNKDATGHWRVCSVCGKTETVAEHTYDAGKVTTPATETEKGVKTYTCTVCGQTKTESIPETGKKEETTPGTGDVGGETPGETPGTEIKDESGTGEYVVTTDPAAPGEGGDAVVPTVAYKAPADASAKTITIPSTITVGGVTYQVTAIADNAFKNNKNLTTVKIDSNVLSIGKNAFYGCKNLKKVTIGDGVTIIGAGAFSGCSKLKTLTIGKNVTTIGDKAFYKCTSLTKVTIPAKVSKIGKQAFYGCTKLKTVIIKTTKLTSKKVAKNAFGKNAKKVTVTLPKLKKSKKTAYAKMLKTKGLKKAKFK